MSSFRKVFFSIGVGSLTSVALAGAGCKGEEAGPAPICVEAPECQGNPVVPLAGDHQMVISSLEIGDSMDGFDIDGDGKPDNKLSAVGVIAGPAIDDAFKDFSIVIPIEFFDYPGMTGDQCVKFAFYLGAYKMDADADTAETAEREGDCNDHDAAINRDATEVADNFKDDDCDGLADETDMDDGMGTITVVPSTNADDMDADQLTIADGDCDDTNAAVKLGAAEICGDGLDNDCNGAADFGANAGGVADCSPFDESPDALSLDPLSFNPDGSAVIQFTSGSVDPAGILNAGPAIFGVKIPNVTDGLDLDLRISCAQITASMISTPEGIAIENGRLGGVLDAHTMDTIRGLDVSDIGLKPEDSLLDAMFANILGTLVGLRKVEGRPECLLPDIDVDRDGLEAFCQSDPNDDKIVIDICIDGDGTEYTDTMNADGTVTHCTELKNADGSFKFADGVSIELNFTAVPAVLPAQ